MEENFKVANRETVVMNSQKYYNTLLRYRDGIEDRLDKKKIDKDKAQRLVNKLNQWYMNHPSASKKSIDKKPKPKK